MEIRWVVVMGAVLSLALAHPKPHRLDAQQLYGPSDTGKLSPQTTFPHVRPTFPLAKPGKAKARPPWSGPRPPDASVPPFPPAALSGWKLYQTGWASWYGPRFHGRLTASGQRYNQYGISAAHPRLPFGTRVRVTNLRTGRSIVVPINDRGPYSRYIIDLSWGAKQAIGMVDIAPVRIEVVR